MKTVWILALACWSGASLAEPTKATESEYVEDIFKAHTSQNLTKADLAWHALNTYGWDCEEVVDEKVVPGQKYTVITCGNGLKLRVYRRPDAHPIIKNMKGGYE